MTAAAKLPQAVHVRRFDGGPRAVLALHCTLAHAGVWRGLAGRLAGVATFTGFDMLSHGLSPDWDMKGDIQDRITGIAETFLTDRMDVIGHSFGATVALRLAAAHPGRIRSLTLIEPVFFAVAERDAPQVLADHEAEAGPFTDALRRGEDELGAQLFNRMWGGAGPKWADLPETARAAMIRGINIVPYCRPSIYDDVAGLLNPGVLDRIASPVLMLRGNRTHPVIAPINDGLARRLPDARNVVIDKAGHMLPISHPAQVAEEMRKLFARSA